MIEIRNDRDKEESEKRGGKRDHEDGEERARTVKRMEQRRGKGGGRTMAGSGSGVEEKEMRTER